MVVIPFFVVLSASGAPLQLGVGVSYLYPAGRLSEGLNGGAEAEFSLTTSVLPRMDLGVNLGYASLTGKENQHLRTSLSPLELTLRVHLLQLTEVSSIVLETGLGVIGISRTLNSGREGSLLGGEGVASLGIAVTVPFAGQSLRVRAIYHAVMDPVERADLFSFGGLLVWGEGL